MASTTAVMTAITVARGVAGASTTTGPGMAAASWSSSASSTRAGNQVTDASCPRPSAARAVRRVGTTAPAVTRRTASNATRPSHSTLGPTWSPCEPLPTSASHPRDSRTGMLSASARAPDGSGTSACRFHPTAGPPTASRRSARSSLVVETVPGPPAQTTTCPADHEAWSWMRPMTSARSDGDGVLSPSESSEATAWSRARSSSKSATASSRPCPRRSRTEARLSSVSRIRRSTVWSQRLGSPSRSARCSSVARPSATAQVASSSSRVASCIDRQRSLRRSRRPTGTASPSRGVSELDPTVSTAHRERDARRPGYPTDADVATPPGVPCCQRPSTRRANPSVLPCRRPMISW